MLGEVVCAKSVLTFRRILKRGGNFKTMMPITAFDHSHSVYCISTFLNIVPLFFWSNCLKPFLVFICASNICVE